jgi:hypothetical protein
MKKNQKQQTTLQVLKGNFTPRNPVEVNEVEENLTTQFEREALKRLGGSIAFVSKKKFLYGMNKKDDKAEAASGTSQVIE